MEEGIALLQLHPKTTLRLWGKVGKGETPFPKSVTPSRICEGSSIQLRGWTDPPRTQPKNIKGGDSSLRSEWHNKKSFWG